MARGYLRSGKSAPDAKSGERGVYSGRQKGGYLKGQRSQGSVAGEDLKSPEKDARDADPDAQGNADEADAGSAKIKQQASAGHVAVPYRKPMSDMQGDDVYGGQDFDDVAGAGSATADDAASALVTARRKRLRLESGSLGDSMAADLEGGYRDVHKA